MSDSKDIKKIKNLLKEQDSRIRELEIALNLSPTAQYIAAQEEAEKPKERQKRESLESRIGENYLQKAGIFVILLGISFFLKYSFDQGWINESTRVIMGVITGLGFLGAGEYFLKKYKDWANIMTGGGIAILYLTFFAAHAFYALIPVSLAFIATLCVTVIAGIAAVRYKSFQLALIGIIGGYLTPVLLGSTDISPLVMMGYAYILALGTFGIAYFEKWNWLNSLTLILTASYGIEVIGIMELNHALIMLGIFLVIFSFMTFYSNLIKKIKTDKIHISHMLFTAAFAFGSMYFLLDSDYQAFQGILALGFAVYYLTQALIAFQRNNKDEALVLTLIGICVAFLSITIPIELDGHWLTIAFGIEAVALLFVGFHTKLLGIRNYAAILGILSLGSLFNNFDNFQRTDNEFIFNPLVATSIIITAALSISAWMYKHYKKEIILNEKDTSAILTVAANIVTISIITQQINHLFSLQDALNASAEQATISVIWTLYSVILVVIGMRFRQRELRWMGLAFFGITITKVFMVDLNGLTSEYRILAFIVLGIFLIGTSFLYQRFKHIIHEKVL